jgi:hypothetical protein
MKALKKLNKKATSYFKAHPIYNSFIHIFIGVGAGFMIVPLIPGDLNMWGIGLIVLGILGHLVALAG